MRVRAYQIRISGAIPEDVLAEVQATHAGIEVQTVLTGSVRDQAELQGLLRRLHNLGLELLDLHQLAAVPDPALGLPPEGDAW